MLEDREFNRYQDEQVRSELEAERRDEIESNLIDSLVGQVASYILHDEIDEIERLENLAEKYNCDLMHANTILFKKCEESETEELIYEVIFRRNKSLRLISRYARLVVDFFDISDEVDRIIKAENDSEAERKQLEQVEL